MADEPEPPAAPSPEPLTCPRCGAPLPIPPADGWITCDYCGVRTQVPQSTPTLPLLFTPADPVPLVEPTIDSEDDDGPAYGTSPFLRALVVVVAVVIFVVLLVASQGPSTTSNTQGSPVASCSVTINASATSGPAPFTATFRAVVTTPPGDSASTPMWQFGPFPSFPDLNFTDGNPVSHTWYTNGTFGVHVSVPDTSLQGCWDAINVNVT